MLVSMGLGAQGEDDNAQGHTRPAGTATRTKSRHLDVREVRTASERGGGGQGEG